MPAAKPHRAPITPGSVRLGSYLRSARGALPAAAVAKQIGVAPSWLSQVEAGYLRISHPDAMALMEIYRGDRRVAEEMLRQMNTEDQSWWHAIGAVLDRRDLTYLAHEASATKIRSYELALVPGLLQTEGYARAILATRQVPRDVVEMRLQARIRRQRILSRTQVHAVISEAALRFQVGGQRVWLEQVAHLAAMSRVPNVTIQILPFSAGAVPAAQDSFTLLTFGPQEAPVAALEQQQSTTWLSQDPDQVAQLGVVHDNLCRNAMTRGRSSGWLEEDSWS